MKKIFTSLMLMLFAVLTVNAQANVFTSNVEFAAGEKSYLTDVIIINGDEYPAFKIGTSKAGGSCKAILPAGTTEFSFHAIGWSKSNNTPLTVVGAGLNEELVAGTGNISGNSPYTFDVDGGYDPEAPYFTYTFETALAEETEVTFASDYRVVFYGVNAKATAAAGWDGTVTTSLDGQTISSVADLEGMTITFNGATTVAGDGMGQLQLMSKESANVELTHAVWFPSPYAAYGTPSTSTIDGNTITLSNWVVESCDFAEIDALPTEARVLYFEDFGSFTVDGEEVELPAIQINYTPAAVEPFAITVSNYRVEGTNGGRQEASEYGLSTGFQIVADPALSAGTAVATLSFNGEDQGEATINAYNYPGAGGSIQFNAAPASTQGMFAAAGEYTLIVPEGVFVDAEGTPNAAFSSTWVILENDATPFDIAGVTMNWMGESIAAGSEVPALSYMYAIDTDKELAAGEGHIEFFDAQGQGIGVGSLAGNYIRFMNFGETGYTTPGTYTLVIPAGAVVDAEGNPCNKFEASWTVKAAETNVINIETVEVGTVTDDSWGTNDVYYTATVKFQKPEGAVYAYSEGLHMELNGENTGVPFTFGQWGMIELAEGDEVTLVYKDNMIAATDDAEFEGDIRPAGSYVAFTEIAFLDADQMELPVTAKFTGSIVLPNLNEVTIGTPVFNVDEDPFYGKINLGDLEANGLKMELTDAEGITPEMTIKVVATLSTVAPSFGEGEGDVDAGFGYPEFHAVVENAEFTGDAMFGAPTVYFTEFAQYISEAGAGAYMVEVSSIEVMGSTGIVASWAPNADEGEILGTVFEVTESLVIENVEAKVGATTPNEYGDQFYTVTLTVPADELAGLGVVKAYTEGVVFTEYLEDEPWVNQFTFNANNGEGTEIVEEQDLVIVCTDAVVGYTTDETYEGDLRAEATDVEATAIIVLVNENEEEVATAEFRGLLTLNSNVFSTATGINKVEFKVTDVKYNLAGQRVNDNAKGIVIMNGKKVLNK